uniref:Uncharacterized protein n=1 Tax=Anguilla anguilla TaxID=7936 RepID=A0A0E9PJG2_ANGAN
MSPSVPPPPASNFTEALPTYLKVSDSTYFL